MAKSKKVAKTTERISFKYAVLGGDKPRTVRAPKGISIAEFVEKHGIKGLTVTLNGQAVKDKTRIKAGDLLIAVPKGEGGR